MPQTLKEFLETSDIHFPIIVHGNRTQGVLYRSGKFGRGLLKFSRYHPFRVIAVDTLRPSGIEVTNSDPLALRYDPIKGTTREKVLREGDRGYLFEQMYLSQVGIV